MVKNCIGTSTVGTWDQWSATLSPGQHTIVLGATGDSEKDSIGIFDAIRVSAIPNGGCTAILLSLSTVGVFVLERVRAHRSDVAAGGSKTSGVAGWDALREVSKCVTKPHRLGGGDGPSPCSVVRKEKLRGRAVASPWQF